MRSQDLESIDELGGFIECEGILFNLSWVACVLHSTTSRWTFT